MVREQQHLGPLADFGQQLQRRCATLVVEMNEKIVVNERQRLGGGAVVLHTRKQERQEKLVTSAVTHLADSDVST